jgi:hypothetical protein
VGQFENLLVRSFRIWARRAEVPQGMRQRILEKAASERDLLAQTTQLPDHLQAWNLPGRKSGTSDMWRFRFGAVLAPYHSGSLKLVM